VSAIVEFAMDTAHTVNKAIYAGVFQRYPGLRLILAHGGGVLPTLGWRVAALVDLRGAEYAAITAEHVADVLRGVRYDTALAASPNSLRPILELTGHDHILFGTDYPAAPGPAIDRDIENLSRRPACCDALAMTRRSPRWRSPVVGHGMVGGRSGSLWGSSGPTSTLQSALIAARRQLSLRNVC
jgi:hypothetical protein